MLLYAIFSWDHCNLLLLCVVFCSHLLAALCLRWDDASEPIEVTYVQCAPRGGSLCVCPRNGWVAIF